MKFDYPITQIEIHPQDDGVTVFIERQQTFTDPDTGEVYRLNRWRSPVPAEALSNLDQFLSRDGSNLSAGDRDFLNNKLKPALQILGLHQTTSTGNRGGKPARGGARNRQSDSVGEV